MAGSPKGPDRGPVIRVIRMQGERPGKTPRARLGRRRKVGRFALGQEYRWLPVVEKGERFLDIFFQTRPSWCREHLNSLLA